MKKVPLQFIKSLRYYWTIPDTLMISIVTLGGFSKVHWEHLHMLLGRSLKTK